MNSRWGWTAAVVEYVGSQKGARGAYFLMDDCAHGGGYDCADRDANGNRWERVVLENPFTGVRLSCVRDSSWRHAPHLEVSEDAKQAAA